MAQQYQVDIVTRVQGASAVAQLEAALKKVQASSKAVDNQAEGVATSLTKLKNAASQSALANSKAALALEKLRLASLKASGNTDKAALAFQKLRVATAESAVNSAKAAAGVNTLGTSAQAAGTKAKASAAGFQSMGAAINAAAAKITIIIGAVQAFSRVMGTAFERQNAEQRLKNLTSSTEEYEAALLSAAAISQKFGMTQTEATKALGDVYSRLSGVGYGLKEVTTIYQGFNAVARESGVSNEAASAAFLQLGQAMGSGVLQGDELRSILEQMPQLTQAIAQQMGIAASQVKHFGSEGKITSDVIFAALQKASEGAVDLNGKLTPAQQQMNAFNKAIDSAGAALGTALIPALTGLLEAITPVIAAVGTLAEKLNELGVSKVFEFLMAPARAFGELVNGAANNTEDLSGKADEAVEKFSSLPQPILSAKAATEQLKESTKQLAAAQREYKAALGAENVSIDHELQVTQSILAAERQINDAKLQQANADLQAAATQAEKETAAKRIFEITEKNAELTYDATMAAAQAEMAKTLAAERHAAVLLKQVQAEVALQRSKKIYNEQQDIALAAAQQMVTTTREAARVQEIVTQQIQRGAQATYDKTVAAARVKMEMAMQTTQQQQTNAQINEGAAAMGRLANEAQRAASASAQIGAGGAGGGGGGGDGTRQWTNAYKPIVTKKLDNDGNIVNKTQEEIKREENALRLQGWKGGILKVADGGADTFGAAAFDASWFGAGLTAGDAARQADVLRRSGGMVGAAGGIVDQMYKSKYGGYADGGYITSPEVAIVGEGGENEYVIPESKMSGAMARYGAGVRGSSVIPDSGDVSGASSGGRPTTASVNINYSGKTVEIAGSTYVSKGDVNGIVSKAVNQTLSTLNRSAGARMRAGLR